MVPQLDRKPLRLAAVAKADGTGLEYVTNDGVAGAGGSGENLATRSSLSRVELEALAKIR